MRSGFSKTNNRKFKKSNKKRRRAAPENLIANLMPNFYDILVLFPSVGIFVYGKAVFRHIYLRE
jgi:hypothetical protein